MSIVSLNRNTSASVHADGGGAAPREQLQQAAEQFEALFLQQILKQMRKAGDVLAADNPMRSRELDTMRDFYDEVLAETLAGKKQTGIADLLVKQLSGDGASIADIEQAGAAARSAELSRGSLIEPLASTWRRGMDGLAEAWQRGTAGFKALVESVIAQESAGRIDAVSSKGARGLMQLMPETAREMAAELGLAYDEARLTSDAAYNKTLGSAYLNKMLARYDGEHALALAAYNAGPGRVDEWLERNGDPRRGEISVGAWIERIPFKETRDYTTRILRSLRSAPLAETPRTEPGGLAQAQPLQPRWTAQTRAQVELAEGVRQGELLGAAVGKRIAVREEPRELPSVNGPVIELARFKSAADPVALQEKSISRSAASGTHQSLSAAFAQPIRIERKETLS
ncbi:lytic transglycosylase [Pseudomonas sp. PIC25]|uniref:lytic transglycosylase domain-containing protein n=1 Tax=Pseudomonas sp. PIC25 TaxID=1958773 RepID=UPI000BABD5B3|nr:transglycosylase SLT domain-containing protein [Pseudomonas sp. PIC25]PAU58396.1 lytic transglycosylase [Pseudomonas sp. PIC25]